MYNDIHLEEREKQQEIGDENEEVKYDSRLVSDTTQSLTFSEQQQQLLDEIEAATSEFINSQPRIVEKCTKLKKVPKILMQNKNFTDYYKPKEISIGPVYAKSDTILFKRELKVKLAARFINRIRVDKKLLLDKIRGQIENLRTCFSAEMLHMSSDELIELLFLDGCSVLEFILSYMSGQLRVFGISNGQAPLIKQDLFLLENQIPFEVLRMLIIDNVSNKDSILWFLLNFVVTSNILASKKFFADYKLVNEFLEKSKPAHLLDLLRKIIIYGSDFQTKELHPIREDVAIDFSKAPYKSSKARSFRNVSELKLSGIKFKPYSHNLDMSFATHLFTTGQLTLPQVIVDDMTICKLLNMVAYEMSLDDYEINCQVTSYVNFLDLLIDSEEDVKELRASHVIINRLSSDSEVAQLFNALGSNCLAPPGDAYFKVKNDIQKHYERKIAIWMAQVYHDHCKSPWTVLALFAAVAILLLTGTQTWYTVNPK